MHLAPEFPQTRQAIPKGQNGIACQWPRLTRKAGGTIGDQQFWFAQFVTRLIRACGRRGFTIAGKMVATLKLGGPPTRISPSDA